MNKTYLLVAQIFAIITGIGLIFTIIGIPLSILNFIAASKLAAAREGRATKEQVRNWSIYLIFTSLIGGIFGLIAAEGKDESTSASEQSSIEQKLKDLDNLFDKGIISKEEYDTRRKKIIESI